MSVFLDEWDYLIHLVQCALHNKQPRELPGELSFQAVYDYGVYHHVANIAFESLQRLTKKPEGELYEAWQACRDRAIIREFNQSFARDEIVESLRQEGIRSLEVQGTRIRELYPCPQWRTMSDLDFIVDLENLPRARTLLESLGYQCRLNHGVEVEGFRSPNIHVELHTRYFPESSEYFGVMRPPFSSVEEGGEYDVRELYLYNILHIAKHYFYGGCGIRRVLDVYYLNQKYHGLLGCEYVQTVLKKAKAAEFAGELSALAEVWFGDGEPKGTRTDMERYLFRSGLHGIRENELQNRLKTASADGGRLFRLRYFLRRLTGTKEIMYDKYPVLKRWKVLYPFCWLHRAACAVRPGKWKHIRKEVNTLVKGDWH